MPRPKKIGPTGGLGLALLHQWCADSVFVIITVYIDESGTHGPAGTMVMAGYLGRLGQWNNFDRLWRRALKRESVSYYHSKTLIHREDEFKGWSDGQAKQFVDRLTRITERNTMFGFVVVLSKEEYERFYVAGFRPKKIPLESQYGLCFRILLTYLPDMICRSLDRDDIEIVFVAEAGHPNSGAINELFRRFKREAPAELARLVKSAAVADWKDFYGLQAADLIATGAYQKERGGIGSIALHDVPKDATIDDMKARIGNSRAPAVRLHASEAVLGELKDKVIAEIEYRRQYGQRKPKQKITPPASDQTDVSGE